MNLSNWMGWLPALILIAGCGSTTSTAAPKTPNQNDPLSHVSAKTLYDRATMLAKQGDYIRAEQYFAAAIDKGYPDEKVIGPLVEACVLSSRIPAGLQYAEPYLARHPQAWSLRLIVASLYYSVDRPQDAENELLRVLEDAPKEPATAHYLLALIYRDAKDGEAKMKAHARRYLDLDPRGGHAEEAVDMLRGIRPKAVVATSPMAAAPSQSTSP
jgi:predicted Zn-dependent protease